MTSEKRTTFNINQIFYQSFIKTQTVKRVLRYTITMFYEYKTSESKRSLKIAITSNLIIKIYIINDTCLV